MGFIPPHMLKAKAASQNVSAEEREASRKTMVMDAARQAQKEGGEKGKTSGGGGGSTEVKGEHKKEDRSTRHPSPNQPQQAQIFLSDQHDENQSMRKQERRTLAAREFSVPLGQPASLKIPKT
ncbi:uncharacterized protein CCOS01_13136 [Colletotrichum costaricense]|uniref:Uncharacterized protein n=1 Tax=Colletotrichum costaricense TaxID=1209916 RepID=A0AAJ0DVR1_9PEZI|nr:uncharacterized protein CCOS01_13136 [Colletotrichum costaricense]KAK1515938.1 hypothetical protein CCOS01_13136 [Colletotrichum costaricense]